jgi:hypothetical protein
MIKKEFTTFWTKEEVLAKLSQMPISRAKFFNQYVRKDEKLLIEIVVPDDISYNDISSFVGRKTKVTIETVDD